MESNNPRLPVSDGKRSSEANIRVQAVGNIHGRVHNYFGAGRPEKKKASFPIHQFPLGSEFFCGREEVLRKVEESIEDCETKIACHRRIVAIIGLGGMGKSEIAKQLAKRLQPKYDFIFWFNAQRRATLDAEFKQLAAILNVSVPSGECSGPTLRNVYRRLAKDFSKAIFIFDNAEQLKRGQGIFGLEEYLEPDLQCKKPVFLITSRYPWGSVRQEIRCFQLDRLSDEESYKCLLNYLRVQNDQLPRSLKRTTASLAKRLEGIPLLISLFGWTLADRADKISLDTIESRVQSYIKLLEGQSLDEVSEESKYEERLQIILHSTVLNMATTPEGKVAAELLNIIALLHPDNIHVGLVNGIYCGNRFNTDDCPRFIWEDLETSVSKGLKMLMKVSLIKIERKIYSDFWGRSFEYDVIEVHRLIQNSTQNWLISVDKSVAPLEKIMRYCEHNKLDMDHTRFLLQFCIQNDLFHLETRWLLILLAQLGSDTCLSVDAGDCELFMRVKDLLRAKKLDLDSHNVLCVLEMMFQEPMDEREAWSKVKRIMLELSPGFTKQRWVIELSCNVVARFDYPWSLQDGNNADFCDWLIQHWKVWREDYNPGIRVLLCLFRCDSNRDWSKDQELISKVSASTRESEWWVFWKEISYITEGCTTEQRIQLLKPLVNRSDENIFSSSLQFSEDSFKLYFLEEWAGHFCDGIIEVARIPKLRNSLLANKRFVNSFWDITSFIIKLSSNVSGIEDYWKEGVPILIGTWCLLFRHDVTLYKCFGKKMDSEIQDCLYRRRHSSWGTGWNTSNNYFTYGNYIREFAVVEHCSEVTRNWIQEVIEIPKAIPKATPKSRNWFQRIFKL